MGGQGLRCDAVPQGATCGLRPVPAFRSTNWNRRCQIGGEIDFLATLAKQLGPAGSRLIVINVFICQRIRALHHTMRAIEIDCGSGVVGTGFGQVISADALRGRVLLAGNSEYVQYNSLVAAISLDFPLSYDPPSSDANRSGNFALHMRR